MWRSMIDYATLGKSAIEMYKQSHRNLGVNFISRGDERGHWHVQCAQSGPPVASGTYAVVYKSKKSKKQAEEKPPEFAVVNISKIKEKQEARTIPTYATIDESEKFQKVPPGHETLDEPKKVCILIFLLHYTAIYRLEI